MTKAQKRSSRQRMIHRARNRHHKAMKLHGDFDRGMKNAAAAMAVARISQGKLKQGAGSILETIVGKFRRSAGDR